MCEQRRLLPEPSLVAYVISTIFSWAGSNYHHIITFNLFGSTWATSWENLFMPYANNKGADQPAHPRSLINAFVVRCLDSIMPLVSISEISILWLVSVAEQAGLCLTCWSQTPKTGFLVMRLNYYDLFVGGCRGGWDGSWQGVGH